MKRIFLFSVLLLALSSCKISAPTFKSLGQWQVSNVSGTEVTLSNTAYFYNPNSVDGIKVNGINVAVQTNNKNIGVLQTNNEVLSIPKLSDFQVPLNFKVNLSDLIGNVSSIVSVLTGSSIDVRCIGDIKVGYSIFNKSVKIDQTVPVSLKDIQNLPVKGLK